MLRPQRGGLQQATVLAAVAGPVGPEPKQETECDRPRRGRLQMLDETGSAVAEAGLSSVARRAKEGGLGANAIRRGSAGVGAAGYNWSGQRICQSGLPTRASFRVPP